MSFFAKVPKGITMAATIFVMVVLQVLVLPALSREVGSGFGALHGINALVMMGVAIMAGGARHRRPGRARPARSPATA